MAINTQSSLDNADGTIDSKELATPKEKKNSSRIRFDRLGNQIIKRSIIDPPKYLDEIKEEKNNDLLNDTDSKKDYEPLRYSIGK